MPLLDAPLPRMAGQLSFMRAASKGLEDLRAGDLAIVGLPVNDPDAPRGGQNLAARGLRETSVYFGWHANAQFSHPVDVDDRRTIAAGGIFERMRDLGDLHSPDMGAALRDVHAAIAGVGATVVFLGGNARLLEPLMAQRPAPQVVRLGGDGRAQDLTLAPLTGHGVPSAAHRSAADVGKLVARHLHRGGPAVAVFDLSVFATSLSGLCDRPRLGGCALPEVATWLSVLGTSPVTAVFLTGLNPTLSGMGIIKTGQRLMVTALLSFVYARLGVATAPELQPEETESSA